MTEAGKKYGHEPGKSLDEPSEGSAELVPLENHVDPGTQTENSPIEQVALTVPITDEDLPVYTFRMWFLGIFTCATLSFLNQFFYYRDEPLIITAVCVQIAALPVGRLLAQSLPTKSFGLPFTKQRFSLNPGPFNIKEHVLITVFANAGSGFGSGNAYAVSIVTIVKVLYKRPMPFLPGLLIIITTQVLGYGWAGLMYKFLVEPARMWWPQSLVQVTIFRTLHEREKGKGLKRIQFFLIALICSFTWYLLPGYLFAALSWMSWVCWVWPNSVLAAQVGSGLSGLGVGSISLDWAGISSYLSSPLVTPWFAIFNVMVGFIVIVYIVTPLTYWLNVYNAKSFGIITSSLYTGDGQPFNTSLIVDDNLYLNQAAYEAQGKLHLSTFFAFTYGFSFAAVGSTLSHVALFYGKDIWRMTRETMQQRTDDVHTRLMRKYPQIPQLWWLILMALSVALSIFTVEYYNQFLQLRWWGVLFACVLAAFFTLPIGIITATTNQTPGLNVFTEYMMGYIRPGQPIANVCFKTYGYISMSQAISFTQDFKLGLYMKIPPRAMFHVQVVGTILAAVVNMGCAWWLLTTIEYICDVSKLPTTSPWTCPNDRVFFDASVIWGLVSPRRVFGPEGVYNAMNLFWILGILAPVPVFIAARAFPKQRWIMLINMPILLGATGAMPPAGSVNYISWCLVGFIFNYYIYKHYKGWWQRYNYVLSGALDTGLALMGVVVYMVLSYETKTMTWWGTADYDQCPLASCPTQPGVSVSGCPLF